MKLEIELSDREKYIIALSLSVGIVAGLWFGVLMTPPRALDVPLTNLQDGAVSASYLPVTPMHIALSVLLPFGTAYIVRNHARSETEDESDDDSSFDFGPHPLDGGASDD